MDLKDINNKIKPLGIVFNAQNYNDLPQIQEITDLTNIEGLYTFTTVTTKNTKNKNSQKSLIWGQPLKVVTVPIIINNAGVNYFLMVSQSRFVFGGKVSLEINKGFISEKTNVDDSLLWNFLLSRKVPYLQDYAHVVKVVDLGNYMQHPDLCTFGMPFQLVFAKTKEPYEIEELKHNLKVKHYYYNEPKSGPPLHNTEPVLKSMQEIQNRLDEIYSFSEHTDEEFYLNDIFSITALAMTYEYIKLNGMPF